MSDAERGNVEPLDEQELLRYAESEPSDTFVSYNSACRYAREILRLRARLESAASPPPAPRAAGAGTMTNAEFLEMRNVEVPCEKCGGWGVLAYGSTSTWHGGIGGQMITSDVCDRCWGSGDEKRRWPSHRLLRAGAAPPSVAGVSEPTDDDKAALYEAQWTAYRAGMLDGFYIPDQQKPESYERAVVLAESGAKAYIAARTAPAPREET